MWKAAKKARKQGLPDPESVEVFNMAERSVKRVAIGGIFGLLDFYEDVHRTDDARHLEKKLGKLEDQAARIIERLHAASAQPGSRKFTITRSELQVLRKFIFIMHYRSNAVDKTYFQEDHPNNISLRNWIRKLKAERGFTSDREIWLQGLQYYLDTIHKDILAHAAALTACSPAHDIIPHAELSTDIPPEHWFAAAYASRNCWPDGMI